MLHGYTSEEMAVLTPQELAALENEAGDADGIIAEIAAGDEEALPDQHDQAGAAESDADDAAGDTAALEHADEAAASAATQPIYQAGDYGDTAALRASLNQEKAAALSRLLDGEMTAADYSVLDSQIQNEISRLDRAETKLEVAYEMTQQQLQREWGREVTALTQQARREGIDYHADEALAAEFDTLVRVFGQEATRKGMSDDKLVASKWALAEAHRTMKSRYGIGLQAAQSQTAAQANSPRHQLKTLGGLPGADVHKVDNDPIARFATLEGEDLERAMARMSPQEQDALMRNL